MKNKTYACSLSSTIYHTQSRNNDSMNIIQFQFVNLSILQKKDTFTLPWKYNPSGILWRESMVIRILHFVPLQYLRHFRFFFVGMMFIIKYPIFKNPT